MAVSKNNKPETPETPGTPETPKTPETEERKTLVSILFEESEAPVKGGNRDATQVLFDNQVEKSHKENKWYKVVAKDDTQKADFERRLRKAANDNDRGVTIRSIQENNGTWIVRFLGKNKKVVQRNS